MNLRLHRHLEQRLHHVGRRDRDRAQQGVQLFLHAHAHRVGGVGGVGEEAAEEAGEEDLGEGRVAEEELLQRPRELPALDLDVRQLSSPVVAQHVHLAPPLQLALLLARSPDRRDEGAAAEDGGGEVLLDIAWGAGGGGGGAREEEGACLGLRLLLHIPRALTQRRLLRGSLAVLGQRGQHIASSALREHRLRLRAAAVEDGLEGEGAGGEHWGHWEGGGGEVGADGDGLEGGIVLERVLEDQTPLALRLVARQLQHQPRCTSQPVILGPLPLRHPQPLQHPCHALTGVLGQGGAVPPGEGSVAYSLRRVLQPAENVLLHRQLLRHRRVQLGGGLKQREKVEADLLISVICQRGQRFAHDFVRLRLREHSQQPGVPVRWRGAIVCVTCEEAEGEELCARILKHTLFECRASHITNRACWHVAEGHLAREHRRQHWHQIDNDLLLQLPRLVLPAPTPLSCSHPMYPRKRIGAGRSARQWVSESEDRGQTHGVHVGGAERSGEVPDSGDEDALAGVEEGAVDLAEVRPDLLMQPPCKRVGASSELLQHLQQRIHLGLHLDLLHPLHHWPQQLVRTLLAPSQLPLRLPARHHQPARLRRWEQQPVRCILPVHLPASEGERSVLHYRASRRATSASRRGGDHGDWGDAWSVGEPCWCRWEAG
eukprot:913779-Rhodomonas_salina.3